MEAAADAIFPEALQSREEFRDFVNRSEGAVAGQQ